MKNTSSRRVVAALTLALATFLAGPAWAEKPAWAGQGQGKKHGGNKHEERERREARVGEYFTAQDRQVVRVYYGEHHGGRKGCPPGLAKKNNGCLPPGQARKLYSVGQPLPGGVVVHAVPRPVLVQLPPAPAGHKYVRIAADILLIAVGTSMVVDAVQDLGRL